MVAETDIKAKVKTLFVVGAVGAILLLTYEVFYWWTHVYESDCLLYTSPIPRD